MGRFTENRETFLQRLPGMNANEQFLLEFAYDIAKEGHGYLGQTRDGGERYFEHVRHVTLILIDLFGIKDINILIPGLFHDLPEDVHIWKVPGRITHVFGKLIGSRTHVLAKPDKRKFATKEAALDFYFGQIAKAGWEACLIKIADRLHNLATMSSGKWTAERQMKYLLETRTYFFGLVEEIKVQNEPLGTQAEIELRKAIQNVEKGIPQETE